MSSKNNVNPDHYKVAGREKMGEAMGQHHDKREYARNQRQMRNAKPAGPARAADRSGTRTRKAR